MTARRVTSSAPTRIDLAGGTLDIWPLSVLVPGAMTVNLAIELRAHVEIVPRGDGKLGVVSKDRRKRMTRKLPLTEADYDGPLSLIGRLVGGFAPPRGLTLSTRATAPAGAGLGGSSTLSVATGAALAAFCGRRLGNDRLLRRVMNLEAAELNVPTGNQDYLAAIHGGLAAYHHEADGTRREKLPVTRELEQRLVLAYTGQPRNSGFSNWDMFRRFIDGERTTVRRMRTIARIAADLRDALREGRLDDAGRLVGEEGTLRYRLAPSVATEALRRADRAARKAGALGVKVCGAGGGGCLVAFARSGKRDAVAEAIRSTGAEVLEARIARRGVVTERS
ncbi:MAG: GHMP kinase [bacterium]|nr:GHMP kinase [bacterium]